MKDPQFAKFVLLVNGAVPAALLAWDAYQHQLGANPVTHAIHITGGVAIIFIALTLCITPVRKLTGWNWLSHFRRMLGLYAFFYACVHLMIYFAFQQSFNVTAVFWDVVDHPFILFGMTALALMIPLAITSNNGMIKRLGAKKWKTLHKLIYIVAISAAIHFWMSTKLVGIYQEVFAATIIVLLGYRIIAWQLAEARKARAPASANSA